jgi:UDP-N-acetylglucosamine diphosphorylase/glucosamine-1-phosphate N-acetyltransferase
MNRIVPDDSYGVDDLFPFTLTRSIGEIRIGIMTSVEAQQLSDAQGIKNSAWRSALTEQIRYPWDIIRLNGKAITEDFALLTKGRISRPIPATVQTLSPENIFIEEDASLDYCILNASAGPIYIGKGATIMEGTVVRGPFALCQGAVVKMGSKIYGATTIGPYCMVGGEIKNSVLFGYSNKAHEGYLGDAVIGEWCNLGAGTSNSNVKNSGEDVKIWNPARKEFIKAGPKCGLLMGDYSRCSINTSFNTGTVVGACCLIAGEGLTPKYIPSFSWGRPGPGASRYEWEKALRDIGNWKRFKDRSLSPAEIQVLRAIFEGS